jgi:hypothetical protein
VINWNVVDGVVFVMFESAEAPLRVIEEHGGATLSHVEFVEKTAANDLQVVSVPSVPSPLGQLQVLAVELDPLPPLVDADYLRGICVDCPPFEMFTLPSNAAQGSQRIVMYLDGRRSTKKVFTILCGHRVDGQLLRPRKLRPEDVLNPPERKLHPEEKYGIYPLVVIDPIPSNGAMEILQKAIAEVGEVERVEEGSAIVAGARRMLLRSKDPFTRKLLMQGLTTARTVNEEIKFSLLKAAAMKDPLSV